MISIKGSFIIFIENSDDLSLNCSKTAVMSG